MLPYVCSVIDHRWRQNVVRTKKWHTRHSRVCHWCSYHILPSFVNCYWTDARQYGIYLLYIIKNWNIWKKSLFILNFANLTDMKIALWRDLLSIQNEANWLVAMLSKELWLVQRIMQLWKKIWFECCCHLCVCPLIDHRQEPIKMRE